MENFKILISQNCVVKYLIVDFLIGKWHFLSSLLPSSRSPSCIPSSASFYLYCRSFSISTFLLFSGTKILELLLHICCFLLEPKLKSLVWLEGSSKIFNLLEILPLLFHISYDYCSMIYVHYLGLTYYLGMPVIFFWIL